MMFRFALTAAAVQATAAKYCNVADFGATGNGVSYDDSAFQQAFALCESGGRVVVPAGNYLLSPFNMTSNMELFLDDDAVLMASTDFNHWTVVEPLPSYPTDYRYGPFIGGDNIVNVTIRGGTIDGQGQAWWDAERDGELLHGRPRLIEPRYCQNFQLIDVHVMNPGFWGVHPYACENVLVEYVVFTAPNDSPNTDGIDPDSCSNVVIRNLTASCGDDAVAIKSGQDEEGREFAMPSKNILIEGGNIGKLYVLMIISLFHYVSTLCLFHRGTNL
jgi:polygalacturonase